MGDPQRHGLGHIAGMKLSGIAIGLAPGIAVNLAATNKQPASALSVVLGARTKQRLRKQADDEIAERPKTPGHQGILALAVDA